MKKEICLCAIILMTLAGCGIKIQSTYDHRVDLRKYKSFCWLKGCEFTYSGPKYLDDSVVRDYFKKAIIAVMKSKGVTYNADYPELLVDVHITVEKKTELVLHRDQAAQISFLPLADPQWIEFLKGTLVIDMEDKGEGRMVWRSVAIGYMDQHPDLTEKNIRKGINKVLKDFPPTPYSQKIETK